MAASAKAKRKEQSATELAGKQLVMRDTIARFTRNKPAMVGGALMLILIVIVVFAPLFTSFDPSVQNYRAVFSLPNSTNIMGTDQYGRDIWARLLYGGRISLMVSLSTVVFSTIIGAGLGAIAAYFGGILDLIITRFLDIIMAIPNLLLAVAIAAAFGTGPFYTVLALTFSTLPGRMRIMRATVMSVKSNDFIEAAQATGSTDARIIVKHVLPNTVAPLIVNTTLALGTNILAISGLSFIGLGVLPPTPEWGSILNAGRPYLRDFWPIILFPSIFIFLTVFAINLLGDGLRDALDPRLRD